MRLRATFWNVIQVDLDLRETAYRYGLIQMQLPPSSPEREITFHYIVRPTMGDKVFNTTSKCRRLRRKSKK